MQKKKKKEKRVKNDIEEQERSRLCELRRELSKAAQEADLGVNAKAGNPEEKWQMPEQKESFEMPEGTVILG